MKYRTIVADPPWPMPDTGARTSAPSDAFADGKRRMWGRFVGSTVALPYETMSLEAIAALPVNALAEKAAHLYVWTTNRFLEETFEIMRGWGFPHKPVTLTWGKPPMGKGFGGAFSSTSEFVLFARRGGLPHIEKQDSTWWCWSRVYKNGHIDHSAKPPAFLDTVEQVSPAPRLEMFARTQRLGWDTWGDEALNHVELSA